MNERIQPGEFYRILPSGQWEIFLDATMCSTFNACPQMFNYSFVQRLAPKGDRPFVRDLGSWWSEVMENIYSAFAKGESYKLDDIATLAMQLWNKLEMDELEKTDPKKYKEFGGRYGALAMIADYVSRQLPTDYATWKIVAAEASFGRNREVCLGETDKIKLYWMGQPDLFVIAEGRVMPVDHKSVSYIDAYISRRYKPHTQLPGYVLAGQILCKQLGLDYKVDRAIINCVARTDRTDKNGDSKKPRFKRIRVDYSQEEIEEWRVRRLHDAERLRTCFETGHWPWSELTCHSWFYKNCPFLNIDEKIASIRPIVITADYVRRDAWIPGRSEKEEEKKSGAE